MISALLLIKPALMLSLACWLSIACFNNIIDRSTNRHLLSLMFSMALIREDIKLGQGLLSRAWGKSERAPIIILWFIVIIQGTISALFWLAAILLSASIFIPSYLQLGMALANWSLLTFMLLWMGFLCGGLWFGYWIKMNHVQMVHLTLLLISLLSVVVINLPLGVVFK